MQAFNAFTSVAIPLPMQDVDTDMIIPAQYLTQINRDGYGQYLFQRLRESDPQFVFNDPSYQQAHILLSGANFGCGSSREHAVWALLQYGIRVVIAESFSDILFSNAAKNGLLLISQPLTVMQSLFAQTQASQLVISVDLAQQYFSVEGDQHYRFDYDPFRKDCLLQGHDDLDYLLAAQDDIDAFAKQHIILGE